MNLAVSMWSFVRPWRSGAIDIPGFVRVAHGMGADGVELLDFFYQDPERERPAVLAALAETGLACPIFSVSNDFAKLDRGPQLERVRFGIAEAGRLGARVVRVFAGDLSPDIPDLDHALDRIVAGLAEAAREAERAGVVLALENHGRLAGRSSQVLDLIARVGSPALGANPDTGNFLLVGEDSASAVGALAGVAQMVHLKDFAPDPQGPFEGPNGDRFAGRALGEGAVNLAECVAALRSAGFSGWLSLEYEGDEPPETAVSRSLAQARRLLRD
jgi:sugar phosphate isomerase/epimerase